MHFKLRRILGLIAALTTVVGGGSDILRAVGKQPKTTDGSYRVTVAGFYEGTGTLSVTNKRVMIQANVRHGGAFKLVAPNLKLDGDHFAGTANVSGGVRLTLRGRLDGYDADPDFRRARVLCTYTDAAGHSGRIVGVLQ